MRGINDRFLFGNDQTASTVALRTILAQAKEATKEEFGALRQEAADFSELIAAMGRLQLLEEDFIANPTIDRFILLEGKIEAVKRLTKKINKESHKIEDFLGWVNARLSLLEKLEKYLAEARGRR